MTDTTISLDLPDDLATHALGQRLAGLARAGDVICLRGNLGTGKSSLARAFIRALTSPDEEVPSPTFTLVQTYEDAPVPVWHFDLYRLESPDEILELGFEDACRDICLIEWPERLGPWLPKKRLEVVLEIPPNSLGRKARLIPTGHWLLDLEHKV